MSAKVLLIDDDRSVTHLVRRALADTGLEVLAASDADTGINLFRERSSEIFACVLDILLPGDSGLDAFRRFHELDDGFSDPDEP